MGVNVALRRGIRTKFCVGLCIFPACLQHLCLKSLSEAADFRFPLFHKSRHVAHCLCCALGFLFSTQHSHFCVYGFSFLEFLAEILLWENGSAPSIPEPHPSHQQRDHVDQWLWGRRASLWLEWQEHWHCQEAGGLLCKTAQPPHAFHGLSFGIGRAEEPGSGGLITGWAFLHSKEVPGDFYQHFWIKYCVTTFCIKTGHLWEDGALIQAVVSFDLESWPCQYSPL